MKVIFDVGVVGMVVTCKGSLHSAVCHEWLADAYHVSAEALLCLSWKSQHKGKIPLGVNSPLNMTSMLTTAHKPSQKNRAEIKLSSKATDQRPEEEGSSRQLA